MSTGCGEGGGRWRGQAVLRAWSHPPQVCGLGLTCGVGCTHHMAAQGRCPRALRRLTCGPRPRCLPSRVFPEQPAFRPGPPRALHAPRAPSLGQAACVDAAGVWLGCLGLEGHDTPRDSLGGALVLQCSPRDSVAWRLGWGEGTEPGLTQPRERAPASSGAAAVTWGDSWQENHLL